MFRYSEWRFSPRKLESVLLLVLSVGGSFIPLNAFLSAQYQRVTDGQTDRFTVAITALQEHKDYVCADARQKRLEYKLRIDNCRGCNWTMIEKWKFLWRYRLKFVWLLTCVYWRCLLRQSKTRKAFNTAFWFFYIKVILSYDYLGFYSLYLLPFFDEENVYHSVG